MRLFLCFLLCWVSFCGYSQSILDTPLDGISHPVPLKDFLLDFEKSHAVRFFFRDEWLEPYSITSEYNKQTLHDALTQILDNEVSFSFMFNYAVIFSVGTDGIVYRQNAIQHALLRKSDIKEIVIGKRGKTISKHVTIKGVIKSQATNSPLSGVIVEVGDNKHVTTDEFGKYEVQISRGENVITYTALNHRERVIILKAYENGTLNIEMDEAPTILQEVVVTDNAILTNRIGQSTIKISGLKHAPTFLGEVDLIKSIQNQAGVTSVSEIAAGFNVRGGGVDQNLVLYDGVPVFNTAHALGFLTSFNSAAIKNAAFFRGGIPAKYGGRSSSVLSVESAEGNAAKFGGSASIGIISSDLTISGPLKKDTTLLFASFRSSYDWIFNAVKSKYNLQNSSVSFYDGSLKLTHKLNRNTKIVFSGYTSSDQFKLVNDTSYNSRNVAASIRLDKTWNAEFSGSILLGLGQYVYALREEDKSTAFTLKYGITYPSLNFDFDYDLSSRHTFAFGFNNTFYIVNPGSLEPETAESNARQIFMDKQRSLESALYFSDEFQLNERLSLEAGLRYSTFFNFGPATVYQYAPGQPREAHTLVDSTEYGNYEIAKFYHGLEPRISMRYAIGQNASVKLGYNRMYQYLHMVSNTAATAPVDIWQSGNPYFKPQIADQVSGGYFLNLKEGLYEVSTEVFYKKVKNILEYKDGEDLILNKNIETALLGGKAHSYGAEFTFSKVRGKLIASVNYTFSRSFRQVNGAHISEKVNMGQLYPSNYDQPHVANVNWQYGISRRVFFSGNFSYRTGRPMSLPEGAYIVDGVPISDFPYRNKYRVPDYHRLDLALVVEGNHKVKKLWNGTWVFSFYNVYARKNAYAVFFKDDGSGHLHPYKLSVIGTAIPSVTYRIKF